MIHLLLIDLTIVPLSVEAAAVRAIIGGKHVDGQQAGLSASEETAASQSCQSVSTYQPHNINMKVTPRISQNIQNNEISPWKRILNNPHKSY